MFVMGSPVSLEAEMSIVVNEMVTSGYPVAVQVTVRLLPDDCEPSVGSEADGEAVSVGVWEGVTHDSHMEDTSS